MHGGVRRRARRTHVCGAHGKPYYRPELVACWLAVSGPFGDSMRQSLGDPSAHPTTMPTDLPTERPSASRNNLSCDLINVIKIINGDEITTTEGILMYKSSPLTRAVRF